MSQSSNWFPEHHSEFTILKWPPQSTDLSPLNQIWGDLHHEYSANKSAATV